MKFTTSAKELSSVLKQIVGITKNKSTMPIISHCLLEVNQEKLTLRATNLEVDISVSISIELGEDGSCCISGEKLENIVLNMDKGSNLTLSVGEIGWAKIKVGKSNFKVATQDPEDYPEGSLLQDGDSPLEIKTNILQGLFLRASYAANQEKENNVLTGIYFKTTCNLSGSYLHVVATDGHRLSCLRQAFDTDISEMCAVLPVSSLKWLKGMLGGEENIFCYIKENISSFVGYNWTLSLRTLEGQFPEYEYIIPSEPTRSIVVERENLISAIKRVSLMSEEKFKPIKISSTVDSEINLSANNPGQGEAEETVSCELWGDEFTIGFNAKYLLDTLEVMAAEKVGIEFTDELSAVMIREMGERFNDEQHVVMPIRIF